MKRVLFALLIAVVASTNAGAAGAKAPKKEKEVRVDKTVGEERVSPPKQRKQSDPDGPPVSKTPGPVQVGPPEELRATKAGSKKFDLRSLPFVPTEKRERPEREGPQANPGIMSAKLDAAPPPAISAPVPGPSAPAPAPLTTFDGLDFANWGAGHPPDTNGDVGPNYYIQTINTSIGVFRKSDGVRVAAFTFNTFMSQGNFGNLCDTDNFGDPVVLYDSFEDRWIITDFAFKLDASNNVVNPPGNFQCFAVSMTGDPVTGGWNYYSINTAGGLGDYPKLGIWNDGVYMSVNMFDYAASGSFQNTRVYALNKTQMYTGSPTVKVVSFNLPSDQFTVLPANARLQTGTPPVGSPNYMASVWNFLNSIQIWKFHVDWDNIPLSSITGPFSSTMGFWWEQYSGSSGTAPTPANANDTLYPRLMVQNQYSNLGGVESLWNSHTVGAGNPTSSVSSAQAAVRYYQVNVTGGTVAANTVQSFTYSPDATVHRYMPSVAVNRAGDIAIGYTTSNATTNPGLKYAGRLAGDAANSITLTEQTLFQGGGAQSGSCGGTCTRWGDYSAMTLDPNGCTFWYTNEYYATNGLNHQTRIGSFTFPSCTAVGAGGTIQGTVTATAGGAAISGATVSLGARSTTTNSSGVYKFTNIPAGTYPTISASYPGYATSTSNTVVVTDGGTTTRNFSLSSASSGSCLVDTTQADFNAATQQTNVDVTTSAGDVLLAKPDLLDQSNSTVSPTGFTITTTAWAGQTFTPAISGQLVRADIELFCNACTTNSPNITVSIRATTGATPVPTGADLATATLTGFNDGGAGGLKTVTFASPFTVTAGTRYAVILRNSATFTTGSVAYTCSCATTGFSNSNPYTTGQRVTSSNSGTTWTADTTTGGRDLNFRIYVNAGYATSGNYLSSLKDGNPSVGNAPNWSTLSWTATTPANTSVKFQVAGSSSANGPFNFVGPDGTAATFFTTSGSSIAQFNGSRYLQYKAILGTTVTTSTPTLNDVTACFTDVACTATGPTITPSQAAVCPGATGRTASAPAGSTNYTWGITNGTITSGMNAATVTYTAGTSGTVDLVLTTTDGTGCVKVSTRSIPIDVVPTPTISAGGSTAICAGSSVTLTSSAASGNQWFLNGNPIGGATANTYNASAAGDYTVQVTSVNGCSSSISTATTVTVTPLPPTPTVNAGGPTTFCAGGSVTLTSSSATGNQWYLNGNPIGGATSNTFNATASGDYTVTVTASGCTSAPSATTTVTVNPIPATPTINAGGPTTFCTGGSVTLTSSSATGNQWYLNGNPIGGATSNTFNATAQGNYTVVVTASGCSSAASAPTNVTVNPVPATPTINAGGPTTFCAGGSVTLTSSSATGNQWYLNGNPIGGATSNTFNATSSGDYTVTVTASGCTSAASTATTVTVNPIPATPTINAGGPTTFCTGGSVTLTSSSATGNQWFLNGNPIGGATSNTLNVTAAGDYSVTVTASGCTSAASAPTTVTVNPIPATPTINAGGPTTFCAGGSVTLTSSSASGNQWYLNGNPIGGATNNTYNATATGNYTVVVTTSGCSSAASTATSVTVNPTPATPTINAGGPTAFCTGGSVTLTSSSATGNQWYLNGNPIGGATSNTYNATASGNYTVTVTASGCSSAASTATTVTVNPIPATPTINAGGPTTFCAGGSVTLTSSSATGNQWYLNGNPIGGATNNTYSATATGNYTVVVTTSGCSSAASTATSVTVNPTPATPTINAGGPTAFCAGGSVTLTSSSAAGNQWYLNGNPIGGATSNTYNATASGNYTVTVTASGCTSAASTATTVTVTPTPATPTINAGGPTTFCAGGSVTLTSSSATGNQWYLNGNPIGGATNNTYSATATGNYTVVVTTSGCSSAASTATSVTVNPTPATPTINAGGPTTFCAGGSVTLTSSSATGNQWYLNGNPIGGATSNTYSATASGDYTVTVTASGCTSAASTATSVTVNPTPATPTINAGGPTTFCAGGSVTLTSSSATGNQWYLNGNPIGGATNNTYNATASGNYTVVVTASGCSSAASTATTVTVNPIPATPTINAGGPTTFCAGGSVTLTSSSATGNQWYLNGNPIGGATNNTYNASVAGDYTVVVTTSGCSSAASAATTVTINPNPNATITAPGSVNASSTGNVASVASAGAGASYNWSITNGTITAGTGTNSITFTAGASGTVTLNVTVTTSGGCTDAKSANVTINSTPISITSVVPGAGKTTGGKSVTINGSGFVSGATVTFGGAAATSVVVVNAGKITALTPAHAAGTVNVVVTNPSSASATLTNGYKYVTTQFDANGDNLVDPSDIFYLVNYLYLSGAAPAGASGMLSGDANGDNAVDPADIFYVVNYLYLSGPAPAATAPSIASQSVSRPMTGSITLGQPFRRNDRWVVPVAVDGDGAELPRALSLRVVFHGDDVTDAAIHRAGAGSNLRPSFEITRRAESAVSFLLAVDPSSAAIRGNVAEIEFDAPADAAVSLELDRAVTLLSNQSGTRSATAAAGTLHLEGTSLVTPRRSGPQSKSE